MTHAAAWRLLCWGMVAVWLVVIWPFGESQVLPLSSVDDVSGWLVRKGLHLTVYGILGGLLALALGCRGQWGWLLALCLLIAFGDELHQHSVPNRSFRVHDLGIDLLGAVLGAFLTKEAVNMAILWREEKYSGV